MKSKLLLLTIFLSFTFLANAQLGLHAGLKFGANIDQITGQSFNNEFSYGYHAGGFVSLNLSKKFSIQPEVLFSQTQQDTTSQFSQIYNTNKDVSKIKLSYLSIPVLLSFNPSKLFSIQAGPQYGILLNQNKNLLENGQTAFKTGDFGVVGGVQLNIAAFKIYGRYIVGLNNINDIDNRDKWKSQSFQIGVGLKLF